MKLTGERTITKEQVAEAVARMQAGTESKGATIRIMFAGGMSVKEISVETGIRYNHVYNVVKNEVLVKGLSDSVETSSRNNENSKKAWILQLLEEGKTITEVSKEMKVLYNYVWQIAKAAGYAGKKSNDVTVETVEADTEVKNGKGKKVAQGA